MIPASQQENRPSNLSGQLSSLINAWIHGPKVALSFWSSKSYSILTAAVVGLSAYPFPMTGGSFSCFSVNYYPSLFWRSRTMHKLHCFSPGERGRSTLVPPFVIRHKTRPMSTLVSAQALSAHFQKLLQLTKHQIATIKMYLLPIYRLFSKFRFWNVERATKWSVLVMILPRKLDLTKENSILLKMKGQILSFSLGLLQIFRLQHTCFNSEFFWRRWISSWLYTWCRIGLQKTQTRGIERSQSMGAMMDQVSHIGGDTAATLRQYSQASLEMTLPVDIRYMSTTIPTT